LRQKIRVEEGLDVLDWTWVILNFGLETTKGTKYH